MPLLNTRTRCGNMGGSSNGSRQVRWGLVDLQTLVCQLLKNLTYDYRKHLLLFQLYNDLGGCMQ